MRKWEVLEDGLVEVTVENKGFFNVIAQKCFHRPRTSYIKLDEYGSCVFQQIDGEKSIYEIGQILESGIAQSVLRSGEGLRIGKGFGAGKAESENEKCACSRAEKGNGAMKHRSAKEEYSNQIPRDGRRAGAAGTEDEGSGHDEHGRIPAEDGAGRLHSAARPAGVKRDAFPASLHGQQCQPDCQKSERGRRNLRACY